MSTDTATVDQDDPRTWKLVTVASQMGDAPELKRKEVLVPELRQRFLAQELTAGQNAKLRATEADERDLLLLCFSLVDNHGHRLWPDHVKGIQHLSKYGFSVIARLLHAVNEVNTVMFDDDPVSDAEGNSETTPSGSTS